MNAATRTTQRTVWVAIRAMLVLTVALGVAYPIAITAVGQLAFPAQANGSVLRNDAGEPVGSSLIGQSFLDASGAPAADYFQPRPSAAGDGYDAAASSGSNYGPENPDLVAAITQRTAEIASMNGVSPSQVPADAVTASSSGLDPHISAAYAQLQIGRVAEARGLPLAEITTLVAQHTKGRDLGFLGETRVNMLELNLALDQLQE